MNNRNQLLIMPEFQYRILKYLLLLCILIASVFYLATYFFTRYWITKGLAAGLEEGNLFFVFIQQLSSTMSLVFLFTSVIVSAIVLTLGLLVSHKIAGPIFKIKKYLKDVETQGWSEPIKLRQGDYFQDLADSVNSAFSRNSKK